MLLWTYVQGQQKIDSLLTILKVSSKNEALNIHLELCYEYIDNIKVLDHAKSAHSIARQNGDSLNIVVSGRLMAFAYKELNCLDSAILACEKVLPIAARNEYLIEYGGLLNTLGNSYNLQAKYDKALESLFKALTVMRELDNKKKISMILSNIGFVYYKIQNFEKALEYYYNSLQLKKAIHNEFDLDIILINISLCFTGLGDYPVARKYIDSALFVCKSDCSDRTKIQAGYTLGKISWKLRENRKAESLFIQSYSLAQKVNHYRMQFDNAVSLAQIYQIEGRLDMALKYLAEAERLIPKTSYNLEVISLYRQLVSLCERKGNLNAQTFYQRKYIHLKDSIYNEDYTNGLMRVQAEYLEHENKTRLAAQQQMLDLKDKIIVRQNLLNLLAGIAAILLILIVWILYRNNKQRKITNQLLDQKVKERTRELESSYNQLRNRLEEEDLTVKKAMADVRSAVATMKGLRSLAIRENVNSESVKQMELLDLMLGRLVEALKGVSEPVVNSSDESGN